MKIAIKKLEESKFLILNTNFKNWDKKKYKQLFNGQKGKSE